MRSRPKEASRGDQRPARRNRHASDGTRRSMPKGRAVAEAGVLVAGPTGVNCRRKWPVSSQTCRSDCLEQ